MVGVKTGLGKALLDFFSRNPDEALTYDDIVAKFGCDYTSAKNAVWYLKARGMLTTEYLVRQAKLSDLE